MGREQSRQSRLATNAITTNAFSAADAIVANAFAATAAASAASDASPASAAAATAVIPFLHCANKYSHWDFDRPYGPLHCFTSA